MWIIRILFISILTTRSSFSTPSKGIFEHEEEYPPYFDEELEAQATEDEYGSDIAAASVTYDKKDYLNDMLKTYYVRESLPPPPPFRSTKPSHPKTNDTSKTNMGGYGKIDISIQYGCCANGQSNPEPDEEKEEYPSSPPKSNKMKQIGQIVVQKDVGMDPTARFHDLSQVFGNTNTGNRMQQMQEYEPMMYRSSDYRNYPEDNINDESESIRTVTTMNPSKSYNNNNNNNRYHHEERPTTTHKPTTQMRKQEIYENYEPVLVAHEQFYTLQNPSFMSTMAPMSGYTRGLPIPTERKSFFTSERILPPLSLYSGYMTDPPIQRGGPPEKHPTTTQLPMISGGAPTTTPSYSYFGNHVTPRSILQDISKIVIQDVPSRLLYSGQQINEPRRHEQTFNVPAQQQSTKEHRPANNNRHYYQQRQQNNQLPQNNNQPLQPPQNNIQQRQNNIQTPQNNIQPNQNNYQPAQKNYQPSDSYQPAQANYQPPSGSYQPPQNNYQPTQNKFQPFDNSYQSSQNQFNSNQNVPLNNNNNYKPGMVYLDSDPIEQNNPTTINIPIEPIDANNLIKKSRQTFLKMQRQVYDLFTKGALNDFQDLLSKHIKKKNIEIPLEEKNMLETKIQPNEELNANILDYLTVYERHSDKLNNTELSNHILQYMERAKEYLSMKLNKFWLELDSMETPDEFQNKKNYYKNREKPTGIMNIFYDWYEKMLNNPGQIDANKIQLKLVDIMKKERRYWLLLLKS